jgi:hypothetical protein
MPSLMDGIAIVSFLIAIASICVNMIQFYRGKSSRAEFEAYVRSSYNADHLIARNCARMRWRFAQKYPADELLHHFWCELQAITGTVDAARSAAVFAARVHMGFTPSFMDPALPNEAPDMAGILGHPSEKRGLPPNIDDYAAAPFEKRNAASASPTSAEEAQDE